MSISTNLRQLRLNNGMTQEQIAEKINVTRQAISSYESGRTRPDIDTLIRLSEIYGTDLDGIVYGQTRALKDARRIKLAAVILFVFLTVLTLVGSVFLWSSNYFYPMPTELSSPHWQLSKAWEVIDSIILAFSSFGFFLLLIFLIIGKCTISWKAKIIYIAAFSAALFAVSFPFALADPIFSHINYITTPIFVISRLILFFIADLIIESIQKRRKRTK